MPKLHSQIPAPTARGNQTFTLMRRGGLLNQSALFEVKGWKQTDFQVSWISISIISFGL